MFRDMTGNTKFARCEGCGEPIFDRWDLLSSYLSSRSAMTIFLRQFPTSLIRFVMRLSDSSWHEDCLFCSQVSHLCLGVVFGGSSALALSQKSIPGQGHVILGVIDIHILWHSEPRCEKVKDTSWHFHFDVLIFFLTLLMRRIHASGS